MFPRGPFPLISPLFSPCCLAWAGVEKSRHKEATQRIHRTVHKPSRHLSIDPPYIHSSDSSRAQLDFFPSSVGMSTCNESVGLCTCFVFAVLWAFTAWRLRRLALGPLRSLRANLQVLQSILLPFLSISSLKSTNPKSIHQYPADLSTGVTGGFPSMNASRFCSRIRSEHSL